MSADDRNSEPIVVERGGGHVTAFIAGLAIGAMAALLLAPKSGAATRRELVRYGRRARRAAERFAGDVRDRAEEAYDDVRTDLRRRAHEARDAAEDVVENVKLRVDAGREAGRAAARAAREELQRRLADAERPGDGDDT
jgi:gas vesicle protein